MSKKNVELRNGKVVIVYEYSGKPNVEPPYPIKNLNYLEYCHTGNVAVRGLFCDSSHHNTSDMIPATKFVRMKFSKSIRELQYMMCDECAGEIVEQFSPYGNTGLTNNETREEG